jgi:hypothetical protein
VPEPIRLEPTALLGGLVRQDAEAPLEAGTWYLAADEAAGLECRVAPGTLEQAHWLTADLLADGNETPVFVLELQEADGGAVFRLSFGVLNQCSARMAAPLSATGMGRWGLSRQGAWLKPRCGGRRVDPARVDRLRLLVSRKGDADVRWCMTPLRAVRHQPPPLREPLLPAGPLVDALGQSTIRRWPTRTRSAKQLTARLRAQRAAADAHRWPDGFSRWGGWTAKRFRASGFFRTHHDGRRWWLVDPEGFAFWSSGLDCVRCRTPMAFDGLEAALSWMPEADGEFADMYRTAAGRRTIDYLAGNFLRAFGPDRYRRDWGAVALGFCRQFGFNTIGNWSDIALAAGARYPYVRPMRRHLPNTPTIYRDFPDVFAPSFAADAEAFARPLRETADDPALIGYFMDNEPTWGFAEEPPAAGMLFTTPRCATREALADFLRKRYGDEAALRKAWRMKASLAEVAEGAWTRRLTAPATADLEAFSEIMVDKLLAGLTDACRRADPNHLNLGVRYYTVPPAWALRPMRRLDVFTMNHYAPWVAADLAAPIEALNLPLMIGEWHFGALDAGPPTAGLQRVADQAARGQAFRAYAESAAARPFCVGAHYFTLYDQAPLGRHDGENFNLGFLDACNRPYEPLAAAARATHERLYAVADGQQAPFSDRPEYLPKHFF